MPNGEQPIPTSGVLVSNQDRTAVILFQHTIPGGNLPGKMGIPAGIIENSGDQDLHIKENAIAELSEEAGINLTVNDIYSYQNNYYEADIPRTDGTTKRFSITVFVYKGKDIYGPLPETKEGIARWISVDELSSCDLLPNQKQIIYDGLAFLKREDA